MKIENSPDAVRSLVTELDQFLSGLQEQNAADKKSRDAIEALRDTDFKDEDAFFKMAQLFRGLAAGASQDSDLAKKFLSQLSDDVTATAKKVLI